MVRNENLRICSLNTRGLSNYQKRRDLFHYLHNKNYSIVCLQETHFCPKQEQMIEAEWGYKVFLSSFSSRARGTAILFKNNFEFQLHQCITDTNGNCIILNITIENHRFTLVCLYGPNKDDPNFFTGVQNQIVEQGNQNVIIVGDWNVLLDPKLDGKNYRHLNNPQAREIVLRMMNDLTLGDIWRENNPDKLKYTWRRNNHNSNAQMGRLDFFLVSETFLQYVSNQSIEVGYRSDHSLITLSLKLNDMQPGKTFWKFNSSLLHESKYIQAVKDTINDVKIQYAASPYIPEMVKYVPHENYHASIDPVLFFEVLLLEIRKKTIEIASRIKREKNEKIRSLENDIKKLNAMDENLNAEEISKKLEELEHLRNQIMKGVLVRSKARWINEGEKVSKYFCNLENRHYISKRMTVLVNSNGDEIENNEDIKNEVKNFYTKLYSSRENDTYQVDLNSLLQRNTPKLTNTESDALEGPILPEEALKVLKNMKNNKSPGSDGFTVEFYKFFWKDVGAFLLKSLNYSFEHNILSTTQREGIITCIPKPGKTKRHLNNWRPITLLNVGFKIASGCIANRIKRVLHKIISPDQSGFIQGRFIGDCVRLIYDVLAEANTTQNKGMLILIDFEKAFDSVAWSFLDAALNYLNFGADILRWVHLFNNNIKSRVIVNNNVSDWFAIERGCRQGDPLSPYLFLIASEILAHMIRQNGEIKGYMIGETEITISQYADDTSLFLDGSEKSFRECIKILEEFSKMSGLKLNKTKTKIIWFGCPRPPETQYLPEYQFHWNPNSFRVLGVDFSVSLYNITENNLINYIEEIKKDLNNWKKRHLTPFGKITVIKSLCISKIIHILTALPSPQARTIDKLEDILFKFLWDDKRSKVKKSISLQDTKCGGLGMIDIKVFINALKITWIKRAHDGQTLWSKLLREKLHNYDFIYKVGSKIALELATQTQNPFWRETLRTFHKFAKTIAPKTNTEFLACSFLHNDNIKVGDAPIQINQFIIYDICLISQLYHNNEPLTYLNFKDAFPNIRIDHVTFAGIIRAIKQYKTKLILENSIKMVNDQPHISVLTAKSRGAKHIYQVMLPKCPDIKGLKTWENRLNIDIEQVKVFTTIKRATVDAKLRWFQFRILHNILTTNKSVAKYNREQEEHCTFCKRYPESIEHLLWNCQYSFSLWNCLSNKINTYCNHSIRFSFNKNLIILGISQNTQTDTVLDLIILLAKHYIYRSKVNKTKPNYNHFENLLAMRYMIEKQMSITNSTFSKFQTKWKPYNILIETIS